MKYVLVTGASTGIGYSTARAFLEKGYHVYGSVRKPADAERLQQELGKNFRPVLFDVTDETAVAAAAAQIESEIGEVGLFCLVNNAGVATSGPLILQPITEIRTQFEVNVIGQFIVIQAFGKLLGARKPCPHPPGKILMISSLGGKISAPFVGAYSGSKHALEGMSNSLRRELLLYGIDVIIIGPGAVKTPIWDKPAATDISGVIGTDYEESARRFRKEFVETGREAGLEVAPFGRRMVAIAESPRPKARYAIVPNRLKDWIVPRLLPARTLDRIIGKGIGLLGKKKGK
ncbi:MAG: SDR family NAD(P)-dependent oxidoreductase [Bacteroidota bacterium]